MVTCALIAERSFDKDEIGWFAFAHNSAGRGHTDKQFAPRNKHLFCYEHCKRSAYSTPNNAKFYFFVDEIV